MEIYNISVELEDEGKRLDAFIASNIEDISRNYIQKLLEKECVKVNNSIKTLKKYKVQINDQIEIEMPEPVKLELIPEDIPIEIVYEDDDVIIVNKPRGMVVHPAVGNYTGTLVNALLYCCKNLSSINGVIRPGIVHRIDKDTSGLLMIAKNNVAHNSLAAQLKDHSITRVYEAIVYGNIKEDSGTIDKPIARHPQNRLKMAVIAVNSKRAVTHYSVIERYDNFTRVEVRLETGRTHQIRVHMAYKNHPLLGDKVYGIKKPKYNIDGQVLHAKTIGFIHPRTNEYMEFTSELPEFFKVAIKKISKRWSCEI